MPQNDTTNLIDLVDFNLGALLLYVDEFRDAVPSEYMMVLDLPG